MEHSINSFNFIAKIIFFVFIDFHRHDGISQETNHNKDASLKRILEMEIEAIRAKEKIQFLEEKVKTKTTELNATRKEASQLKHELDLLKEKNGTDCIRSSSMNVRFQR